MDSAIQAMIMAILVAVSVGYIFLQIMLPTNLYRNKWIPKIYTNANSTYLGMEGASLLIFVFPVLFIAAFGCVYLHLRKKKNEAGDQYHTSERNSEKSGLAAWKRPIIIKGLGVVSRIELAFFFMFIALLVWCFAVSLHNYWVIITPQFAALSGEKVWQVDLEAIAFRLGIVGNICVTFLFFPVARGSSVLQIFGLTSESSIKYHIWLGHIAMILFTAHGVSYIAFWALTHQSHEMLKWAKTGVANIAGEVALLAGLVMWVATLPRIRRKFFELFFYTHHLYTIFMLFLLFHIGISISFCYVLPGFYLFMIDRYLRFLQSRHHVRLVSARVLPSQTVELNFSKTRGLSFQPTSVIFINVPSISRLQWHPFTVSSSSNLEPEKLSVIIKVEGSWTSKLHKILSSSPSSIENLAISVEGPYGPTSTDFLRYETLILVSGGSGITPFISIIRELIFASETLQCKTPSIILIAAFKKSSDLAMLELILPMTGSSPSQISKLDLKIEAYVTRDKEPSSQDKKTISAVWFKPRPSDSPISPILGQNNWLWLGAIISASFIIFLIFIGILTRYYIYPIDHGTNMIFSDAVRNLVNALFLCLSVVIVATLAFLWNKKQNAMESKQIQSLEGATPAASPNSWFYNGDRELESLPQESLALSTNVHFGERPDLKRILLERKEDNVGVLVSGPKKLRHEVAKICSSGLASNLHCESISFSW